MAKSILLMGRGPDGRAKKINVDENGNFKVQLSGRIEASFDHRDLSGSRLLLSEPAREFGIVNTGDKPLVFAVGDVEIRVPVGGSFSGSFDEFSEVKVWQEVVFYTFDGDDPLLVKDRSGNGFDAVGTGGLSIVPGIWNNDWRAIESDGETGYFVVDEKARIFGKDALKLECIFQVSEVTSDWRSLVNQYRSPGSMYGIGWYLLCKNGRLYFGARNPSGVIEEGALSVSIEIPTETPLKVVAELDGEKQMLTTYTDDGAVYGHKEQTYSHILDPDNVTGPIVIFASNRDNREEKLKGTISMLRLLQKPDPMSFYAYCVR